MKILTNKFFLLGNLLLLLIAIPVTLYFVKSQQEVRSHAAASSKLYFTPATTTTSTQCQSFSIDLTVDPGSNIVSIVDFYLTYDPSLLTITQITPADNFSTTVRASSIADGTANMSVSVGADVTKAVSSISKVATITFTPKTAGAATVKIDSTKSRIFSLGPADQPTENVLSSVDQAAVTIGSDTCLNPTTTGTITPTVTGGATGTVTPIPSGGAITPTVTGTQAANQPPICTTMTVSPNATGSAPFSALFTGTGNDPDASGLITKATFVFGDGQSQDVTTGLNQQSVTAQASHTYVNAGTFPATVTFTDNNGGVSQACTQNVTAQASSASATVAPTAPPAATSTPVPTLIAANPTAVPTVPPTGSIGQTLGIIATVVITIAGGIALLAL